MKLEVQQRDREDIVILQVKGTLTAGEGAAQLRESMRRLLDQKKINVILDFGGVDYIDSTGLGAMVVCYTSLRKAGGRLVLLNLNKRAIELLLLTKLSTIFELFDDEQHAINSFFPDREIKHFDILQFVEQQKED